MEGRLYLTPFGAGAGAHKYLLEPGRHLIGRAERAAVVLRDTSVSREHAVIELHDHNVWIEDLGSKHGTFVNSRRVQRAQLQVGDIVVIGLSVVLRLDLEAPLASAELALESNLDTKEADADTSPGGLRAINTDTGFAAVAPLLGLPNLEATGRLCLEALPIIYARLNGISDSLRRAAAVPGGKIDPANVLKWFEPVVGKLMRLMAAIAQGPGQPPPLVMLNDVIDEALRLAGPALAVREVALDRQVPLGLGLRVHPGRLADAIAALLVSVSDNISQGSVVTLEARATDDGTELQVVLPAGQQLNESNQQTSANLRRASALLDSIGLRLTRCAGRLEIFIGDWNVDDYSSGG